jgi:hypothetical protein
VDAQPREGDPGRLDEVARQRKKHQTACLNQPVPGFPRMTVGQLADEVRAATTGAGTCESVTQFLRSGGYGQEAIERVLRCLELDPDEPPVEKFSVYAALDSSPGEHRFRTLAQLEALLLKD